MRNQNEYGSKGIMSVTEEILSGAASNKTIDDWMKGLDNDFLTACINTFSIQIDKKIKIEIRRRKLKIINMNVR